ncbi:MAG: NrtA/SsuA/CpmA family ABC transporter substrate-binding protein [Polyangiales bacterium]
MHISRRSMIAGVGAALLAGCGKSEANTSAGRKKVRLTHALGTVFRPRGVMEKRLAEQGIDVEWLGPFPNHAPTLQAVATGSADFSFGGSSTPAAQALLSGAPLRFVAWSQNTPRNTSIIVKPESGIEHVRDLVGKTVAVNKAGVAEFLLVAALEKYKVPRDKVEVRYLNPPDAAPAFGAGQIDAWAIWHGPLEMAEVKYGARRIFTEANELDYQIDYGSYLVHKDFVASEPEVVRKVIAAYQEELGWVNAHRKEATELGFSQAKYPPEVIARIVDAGLRQELHFMDDPGVANLQRGFDWLSERKILSGSLKVTDYTVRL